MRLVASLAMLMMLTACATGLPFSDIAIVGGAGALMYGDDIEDITKEDLKLRNATPPQAKSTTNRVANHVRDNVRATSKHLKEWWFYDPNATTAIHDVPDSYCYRAQGDVLCYRAPMPGWEHRLIGYQGTYAKVPSPVMMQPLPGQSVDASMLPENRVANAKPVFAELPPEIKEEAPKDATTLLEADPQNVQETIQDPNISPQL